MSENKSSGGLITGLAIGAALGAGITFLFGTKKGKEIRDNVREKYPDFFDQLEDALGDVRENLSEEYETVVDEVQKVKDEVSSMTIGEASDAAKDAVVEKVDKLGVAVASLGKQIEKASAKPRLFKGIKRHK
ncbi:YtxH domain-containing protein [Patescibacteria group bacterium]|nr:YtxH domain-containing protein [Patescibacteria group bacterium]